MSENEFRIRSGFIHPQSSRPILHLFLMLVVGGSIVSIYIRTILGCIDSVLMGCGCSGGGCAGGIKVLACSPKSEFIRGMLLLLLLFSGWPKLLPSSLHCKILHIKLQLLPGPHRVRKSDQTRGQFVAGADL